MRYPSFTAAVKAYGIKPHRARARKRKYGGTVEEIIDALLVERPRKVVKARDQRPVTTVIVHGVAYPNIESAAKAYGVKSGTVSSRMKDGWTVERAIDAKKEFARTRSVVVLAWGIIHRRGRTPEEAIDAILARAKGVMVRGVRYRGIKTAALAHGVAKSSVLRRIKTGETAEQAINWLIAYRQRKTPRGKTSSPITRLSFATSSLRA